MNWNNCFSERRTGISKSKEVPRTEYQRDFDRLIFASSFRRLQNKTQVFPLPGSTFVHNRLTHSLEVACVGRSLGKIIGTSLAYHKIDPRDKYCREFYSIDLASVIASACLAHDIGNPAFGHSGEKAISNYFLSHKDEKIEGRSLVDFFTKTEWVDLVQFEGNANALRVLTHSYRDKPSGGMRLTFTTLAALIKYPCEARGIDSSYKHRNKYGFFQTEKDTFQDICRELHMIPESEDPIVYKRHPFVYLVEAADDICYRIIDLEDGQRLGIISKETVSSVLLNILEELHRPEDDIKKVKDTFSNIKDDNDSISYLRAKTINALTLDASDVFLANQSEILEGNYSNSLMGCIENRCKTLKEVTALSVRKIYNHYSVVEIEITGFHIMSHLLNLFVPAVLRERKIGTDRRALELIPYQFREYEVYENPYRKALSVVDFISGMTDTYATEFYRKTTGIDISKYV